MSILVLEVFLHEGRYHGAGEPWPSPARLFGALVAGAATGAVIAERAALEWLEQQAAPRLVVPTMTAGRGITLYVPDNDLDAVGNDPRRVSEIRSAKSQQPWLFDAAVPFAFVWRDVEVHDRLREGLRSLCARLFQFGRGIDQAWARERVLDDDDWSEWLRLHGGRLIDPGVGEGGAVLRAPMRGTLASLEQRFHAGRARFAAIDKKRQSFQQAPKARFASVVYGADRRHVLLDLRDQHGAFWPWPLARVVELVESVRATAEARLARPEAALALRGTDDGDRRATAAERVRITALPSIGMQHTDPSIRRVLVEVPAANPIALADWRWALQSAEPLPATHAHLVAADEAEMLAHYTAPSRLWRTVTPVALPEPTARRRIEPARQWEERKPASERDDEERRATAAVFDALRHAGEAGRVARVHVQREPFGKGERVEQFATPRFRKERLWHIEIEFMQPRSGVLVVGDGRFLGLGLFAPVRVDARSKSNAVFSIDGLASGADPRGVARAARRAVLACVGAAGDIPESISGHRFGGEKSLDSGRVSFVADVDEGRLYVCVDRRVSTADRQRLEEGLGALTQIAAGAAGLLRVRRVDVGDDDRIVRASRCWRSLTSYVVERHAKTTSAQDAVIDDVTRACARAELPRPVVTVRRVEGHAGRGVHAEVDLAFANVVQGPLLLGRDRFDGGGVFVAVDGSSS
jgi:CRISPR-associated protein Csb2